MLESEGNTLLIAKNSALETTVELNDLSGGKSLSKNHFDVELKRAQGLIEGQTVASIKTVPTALDSISAGEAKIGRLLSDKTSDALLPNRLSSETPDQAPSRAQPAANLASTSLTTEDRSTKPVSVNRDAVGYENSRLTSRLNKGSPSLAPTIVKLSVDNLDSAQLDKAASASMVPAPSFDDTFTKPINPIPDDRLLPHAGLRTKHAASVIADADAMPASLSAYTLAVGMDSAMVDSSALKAVLSQTQSRDPANEGRAADHVSHSAINVRSVAAGVSTEAEQGVKRAFVEQTNASAETADLRLSIAKPVSDPDPTKMGLTSADDVGSRLGREQVASLARKNQSSAEVLSTSGGTYASRILGSGPGVLTPVSAGEAPGPSSLPVQLVENAQKLQDSNPGELKPLLGSTSVNSKIELSAESQITASRAFLTGDQNVSAQVDSATSTIAASRLAGTDIKLHVHTMPASVVTKNSIDTRDSTVDTANLYGNQKVKSIASNADSNEVTVTNLSNKALSKRSDALLEVMPATLARRVSSTPYSIDNGGLQAIVTPHDVMPSNVYHVTTHGTITANSSSQNTGLTGDIASAPRTVLLSQPGDDQALVDNVRWAVSEKLSRVTVNVTPANLGPITVSVDVENQSMSVSILANNAVAKDALDSLLPRVREHFTNEGYQQVSVDVSSQQERKNNLSNRAHHPLIPSDVTDVETSLNDPSSSEGAHASYQQRVSNSLIDTYV